MYLKKDMTLIQFNLLFTVSSFTVKPDVLVREHCNIIPQYFNFDRQIALSNLQATRTNCELKFTKDL